MFRSSNWIIIALAGCLLLSAAQSVATESREDNELAELRERRDWLLVCDDLPGALALADRCLGSGAVADSVLPGLLAGDLQARSAILLRLNRLDEAVAENHKALAILNAADPYPTGRSENARALGAVLHLQAMLAQGRGEYVTADSLYLAGLRLAEGYWGANNARVAYDRIGLANLYQVRGHFPAARDLLEETVRILEDSYGPNHPRVADALKSLGVVLRRSGDTRGAVAAYRRSLAIDVGKFGEDHIGAANTMVNLSFPLGQMGQHAESLELLRKATATIAKRLGPEHPQTIWSLGLFAQNQREHGNLLEAERLYRRCLTLSAMVQGPKSMQLAWTLRGMGLTQVNLGDLESARKSFDQATQIARFNMGDANHLVAVHERESGLVDLLLGEWERGREILERCTATLEEQLGADHQALIRCLGGLAFACLATGDIEQAEELAERALTLAHKALGNEGPVGTRSLLIAARIANGRYDEALRLALEHEEVTLKHQDDLFPVCSERDALNFASVQRRTQDEMLATLHAHPAPSDSLLGETFSAVCLTYGRIVDRFALRRQLLDLSNRESETGMICDDYLAAAQRVADLVSQNRSPGAQFQSELAAAYDAKDRAERMMAGAGRDEAWARSFPSPESRLLPGEISELLEPGDRVLHYVRYPTLSLGTDDWTPGASSLRAGLISGGTEHYGAFLLEGTGTPRARLSFTELGDASKIDSLIADYRKVVESARPGAIPSARLESEFRNVSRRLHEILWQPLLPERNGKQESGPVVTDPLVYLLPAGRLHLLDFNSLIASTGVQLIRDWRICLLSSLRDLAQGQRYPNSTPSEGILAVGNPERGAAISNDRPGMEEFGPLPGSEQEATRVAEIFGADHGGPVTVLCGAKATESAVKELMTDRGILHLAVHGYYWPTEEETVSTNSQRQNILMECGLLLAPDHQGGDGFLSAQEIVAQNLTNVDLVVLSACNSGLGPMVPGEGLFGLRRAFEIAGARSIITALWRVDDIAIRDLMENFYRKRLQGLATVDALRAAQWESLQDQPRGRLHPARWGGLVAEGRHLVETGF